jgi:hypothetical protein
MVGRRTILEFFLARNAASPKIDVAKFKDAASVNRKYTIPLL